jgi:hypothetical protein
VGCLMNSNNHHVMKFGLSVEFCEFWSIGTNS